jgi:hypothetical protein
MLMPANAPSPRNAIWNSHRESVGRNEQQRYLGRRYSRAFNAPEIRDAVSRVSLAARRVLGDGQFGGGAKPARDREGAPGERARAYSSYSPFAVVR